MSVQPRQARVFAALLLSMTVGVMVLVALSNKPPAAGAFCLSRYYRLDPVEKVIFSRAAQSRSRWNSIEICYSGTRSGNIEQLTAMLGLAEPADINCHFVICNGLGGDDGQISATGKWQRQWSITSDGAGPGSGGIIRICVIAESKTNRPTDFQIKRTQALTEGLCRKFNIQPQFVHISKTAGLATKSCQDRQNDFFSISHL